MSLDVLEKMTVLLGRLTSRVDRIEDDIKKLQEDRGPGVKTEDPMVTARGLLYDYIQTCNCFGSGTDCGTCEETKKLLGFRR